MQALRPAARVSTVPAQHLHCQQLIEMRPDPLGRRRRFASRQRSSTCSMSAVPRAHALGVGPVRPAWQTASSGDAAASYFTFTGVFQELTPVALCSSRWGRVGYALLFDAERPDGERCVLEECP